MGRVHRLTRRQRWVAAKIRDKSFSFDGRFGGHDNKSVPALGQFEEFRTLNGNKRQLDSQEAI